MPVSSRPKQVLDALLQTALLAVGMVFIAGGLVAFGEMLPPAVQGWSAVVELLIAWYCMLSAVYWAKQRQHLLGFFVCLLLGNIFVFHALTWQTVNTMADVPANALFVVQVAPGAQQ